MATSSIGTAEGLSWDKHAFNEQVTRLCEPVQEKFNRIIRGAFLFHAFFFAIAFVECGLLVFFLSLLSHSFVLAITLAVAFLTLFSYLVLRLYLQARLPEQLLELREEYVEAFKEMISYQEGLPEHHMALANALRRFAANLQGQELKYFPLPDWLEALAPTAEKLSSWLHWKDLHRMKELLLNRAVEEHIQLVKCAPTNLEVHAALANAYVMLSSLYIDPRKVEGYDEERWVAPQRYSEEMQLKFRAAAERAIEEFNILKEYAPNDPWVHAQLAYSYHDLQMPEEEIREYEAILKLCPEDKETLFKLGVLYFQQGMNAKGLRVYEELISTNFKKAENLIKFYGEYAS